MRRSFPQCPFARYADDAVVHCRTKEEAQAVMEAIRGRLLRCHLELHPTKKRIVHCKDDGRPGGGEITRFDFLGYTFQPRLAKSYRGKLFVSFLPAISNKAAKRIRQTIRSWRMPRSRRHQDLETLASLINPAVHGWMNCNGRFYRSRCVQVLRYVDEVLVAGVSGSSWAVPSSIVE